MAIELIGSDQQLRMVINESFLMVEQTVLRGHL